MKPWYIEFFKNYGKSYDNEEFVRGTRGEVDFFEKEVDFDKEFQILDVGCGTGRHTLELASRGYRVTGLDLSGSMLNRARQKAAIKGLSVDFIQQDARDFDFAGKFDLCLMICEGAFPLMETDEMNFKILKNAAKSLKPAGKFIFTTLNGLFALFHSVEEFEQEHGLASSGHQLDLLTMRIRSTFEMADDDGVSKTYHANERYYLPSEITWLLKSLDFVTVDIFGCELGAFSRETVLTKDHHEMLVVAVKE